MILFFRVKMLNKKLHYIFKLLHWYVLWANSFSMNCDIICNFLICSILAHYLKDHISFVMRKGSFMLQFIKVLKLLTFKPRSIHRKSTLRLTVKQYHSCRWCGKAQKLKLQALFPFELSQAPLEKKSVMISLGGWYVPGKK